jgi:hypothetical protein
MKKRSRISPEEMEAALERVRPEFEPPQITKLRRIKVFYDLSLQNLGVALYPYLGITPTAIWHMLDRGTTKESTLAALDVWLRKVGRKKYPLPEGYDDDGND